MSATFVERPCVFTAGGRAFEAGGAAGSEGHLVAYLGEGGVLTDWHGSPIGTYRITATWRTPRSFASGRMHQVEATVGGRVYTGRSAGVGCVYRGRRKKSRR